MGTVQLSAKQPAAIPHDLRLFPTGTTEIPGLSWRGISLWEYEASALIWAGEV